MRGVSFAIARGRIFGFLGPSGAGKSTTQRILTGILKDYAGTVRVDGREVATQSGDFYRRIGVMFELPNLYSRFTARENLTFFAALQGKPGIDPEPLLERLGLSREMDARVGSYSKGMKMRLNLARALMHEPEILFVDEPTSGLDPVNAKTVKELIREQRDAGRTVFLTTHNMEVAEELCDTVSFIVDGRLRLTDSPRALKLAHGQRSVRVEYLDNGGTAEELFDLGDLGTNQRFQRLLHSGTVETIHTQEASLEDVFVATTGRGLA